MKQTTIILLSVAIAGIIITGSIIYYTKSNNSNENDNSTDEIPDANDDNDDDDIPDENEENDTNTSTEEDYFTFDPDNATWRDISVDGDIINISADLLNVSSNMVHIYFYVNISNNASCDRFVGAVAENNSSVVFRFNSTTKTVTFIEGTYSPTNTSEIRAFYLIATSCSSYAGENLVPSELRIIPLYQNNTNWTFIKYYDGWYNHALYGVCYYNITSDSIVAYSHVW